ncbi:MAG TPA: alpha-amylase family glycosyl hydrolase [Verrucomicrobiae bacterium]|nr:alpha-amylase family glycosyl hydrolase [Verrucomicrobiae bacterium]
MNRALSAFCLTTVLSASAMAAGPFAESGGVAVFEAEDFSNNIARSSHVWTFTNDATGFGGSGYMQALPDDGAMITSSIPTTSPELQFTVDFGSTGQRYIWVRGNSPDANGASVHAGLDGVVTATNISFFTPNNSWVWTNRTSTGNAGTFTVGSAGIHTFNLWMREDGMRVDKVVLTTNASFTPTVGNAFHIPNNFQADLGGSMMRDPYGAILPANAVTLYTGNQFQGSGNPGNQLQTGSTLFYRKSTDVTWNSLPMAFLKTGTSNPNNKYYSVTIPANTFSAGDTVQYYFKIPFSDHLTTFVYGNDAQRFDTEIEAIAQANPFSFSVKSPPTTVTPSPSDWRDLNIYQIVTDRYDDDDPSNNMANPDGIFDPASGGAIHGGDFKGIERKLDYIKALGANAIWISPIVHNAFAQYHGYSGWDFYSIDPHWGTFEDLTNMITAAHARGIYVILDMVCNHGGDLIDSTDAGYLTTFKAPPAGYNMRFKTNKTYPPPFDTNGTNPMIASLFHTNGLIQDFNVQQQVELGELRGLDDLRTELTYVRTNMVDIYEYWIGAADFDGFRVDTTKHVENNFWQFWCSQIHQFAAGIGKSNFFVFGETLTGSDSGVGAYTGTKSGGNFEYDSMLDYPLYFTINPVFANASGNTKQIEDHYNAIGANYDSNAWFRLVSFLDNHDQSRFLSADNANNNTNRLGVALAFLYTARGIPCLYYGTEQAFNGVKDANNSNREDMFAGGFEQGPSLGDNFNETQPLFQLIAKLNNFRRLYSSLRRGGHRNLWNNPSGPGLFAYSRTNGNEEVFVVLNTANSTQTLTNRSTTYPQGTVLVNLLDTNETVTVIAGPQTPPITIPGTSAKLFIAQSLLQPLDPVVISQSPAHAATNVSPASSIVLQFSKPMDTNSVQAAFSLTPASTGTFSWSALHDTMTFTANGLLPVLTTNVLHVGTNAMEAVSTNAFFAPFETYFVTAATTGTDFTPPGVAIATPSSGSAIAGNLTVSGIASDDILVARVEVQVDGGNWIAASGTASWGLTFNTANFLNGSHIISARATDFAGNVSPTDTRSVRFINVPGDYVQRISAGSFADVTNCDTSVWGKDQSYCPGLFGFSGGSPGFVGDTIDGISCVDGQLLYERDRTATNSFAYIFDCPEGLYETTLLESETRTNVANGNVFNIFIQGQQVITNLDVFSATGGMDRPLSLILTNAVTNSQLYIEFTPVVGLAPASGIQVRKIADLDTDSDGIPDWWMWAYFDHPTGQAGDKSLPGDDADGDGMSNWQECLAGTDPDDPNSVFRIDKISVTGNDIAVTWTARADKTNQLESSRLLATNAAWLSVGSPIVGAGTPVTQTDFGAATNPPAFYRVRLVP